MALIGHEAELHRSTDGDPDRQYQGHGPEALDPILAAQRKEDHPLDPAGFAGLDRQPEGETLGHHLAQRQGELLHLHLLPTQRPLGRLIGSTAKEAHRHALALRADDENEVGAVVQHREPGIVARAGGALEAMPAKGEGAAANRPGIVTEFVAGHGQRIMPGMGEQASAEPQTVLGQGGMVIPGQARGWW